MTMNRRDFLKTSSACVAAGLSTSLYALPVDTARPPSASIRSMQTGFGINQYLQAAICATSTTANSEVVHLPHSNVLVPWHGIDQKSYQFVSLYRRHFTLSPEEKGAPRLC